MGSRDQPYGKYTTGGGLGMKDKEKQRLKLQLGQLAEWLTTQEDEELLQSILSVCRAFLSLAE